MPGCRAGESGIDGALFAKEHSGGDRMKRCLACFVVLLSWAARSGAEPGASGLQVSEVWVRETPPGRSTTAVYMKITNWTEADDALISASTEVAQSSVFHQLTMTSGTPRVTRRGLIALPARANVDLAPGGPHIEVLGVRQPLKEGGRVKIVLKFQKAAPRTVEASVRREDPPDDCDN